MNLDNLMSRFVVLGDDTIYCFFSRTDGVLSQRAFIMIHKSACMVTTFKSALLACTKIFEKTFLHVC